MLCTGRPTYSAAGPCLSAVCLVSHLNDSKVGWYAGGGRPHTLHTGRSERDREITVSVYCAWCHMSMNMRMSHVNECKVGVQAVAGHICYVLAGLHVQPHGPASQVCLVGADHHSWPRCFATISALQRSEVLEWARSQGRHTQIFV